MALNSVSAFGESSFSADPEGARQRAYNLLAELSAASAACSKLPILAVVSVCAIKIS